MIGQAWQSWFSPAQALFSSFGYSSEQKVSAVKQLTENNPLLPALATALYASGTK